jgi:hypothetical protein
MKSSAFFLFFALLCTTSCTRRFVYSPAPNQGNGVLSYNHGYPLMVADLGDVEAHMDLSGLRPKDLALRLSIQNNQDVSMTFLPEQIRVTGYNAAGEAQAFRVFTAEEFIRRRNTRKAVIIGSAIVATAAVATAVALNNDNNFEDDCRDNFFFYDPFFYATPAVVINANAQNNYTPSDGLLRRHTIYPGELLQGVIRIKGNRAFLHHIKVEIPDTYGTYQSFVFDSRVRVR